MRGYSNVYLSSVKRDNALLAWKFSLPVAHTDWQTDRQMLLSVVIGIEYSYIYKFQLDIY